MIEWFYRTWRTLPDKSTCTKYGPCTELLVRLRNLQSTNSIEGIQQIKSCLEDIQTDADDLYKDMSIIIYQCE